MSQCSEIVVCSLSREIEGVGADKFDFWHVSCELYCLQNVNIHSLTRSCRKVGRLVLEIESDTQRYSVQVVWYQQFFRRKLQES